MQRYRMGDFMAEAAYTFKAESMETGLFRIFLTRNEVLHLRNCDGRLYYANGGAITWGGVCTRVKDARGEKRR